VPGLALGVALAWLAVAAGAVGATPTRAAMDPRAALADLASGDPDRQETAVGVLGRTGGPEWLAFLAALRDGHVYVWTHAGRVDVVIGGARSTRGSTEVVEVRAAGDSWPIGVAPVGELTELAADRRLRAAIRPFLQVDETRRQLADSDPAVRRAAAVKLGSQPDAAGARLLEAALAGEPDPRVRYALREALALTWLAHGDASARVRAAEALGALGTVGAVGSLRRLAEDAGASAPERAAATAAIRRIERWGLVMAVLEAAFQGLSLASILLLMALGLAIVFGLMGVINMAHGELMALGAYATFVVQNVFRARWPAFFDAYFLVALPVAFAVAGAVGLALERGFIRFLYGRPLETLLLTWGASLIVQQGLRLWFGAANVDVAAPRWLSGGAPVMVGLQFPYNRLFIIGLAVAAVGGTYWLLFRTATGLRIRAVTQNRAMAASLGVRAGRVDAATFAFGAGLAGLAGSALTQIGNVGPSLGQNYIVDAFLVVVTGGVGKLAGTVLTSAGLGGLTKAVEPVLGAVFAKVAILLLVILFLQRRPAGLFATRGRLADA
jgi:urea transport system permease protein